MSDSETTPLVPVNTAAPEPPVFPEIPATDPTVIPPTPGSIYDQWFLTGCNITSQEGTIFNQESFWIKGNTTELSSITTNNILRNITSIESLTEQLGQEFLDQNPDVITIMPQFLEVLAKIAKQQGVL